MSFLHEKLINDKMTNKKMALIGFIFSLIITHNGLRLGVVADYYHKCSYEAHTSNIAQMFLRSTSPAITPNRC
jgi:predicted solute-binding protein